MSAGEEKANYLKIEDAARFLGVSRRWVYRRVWSGELPAAKVGGIYFIDPLDLQAVMAQGKQARPREEHGGAAQAEPLKCGYCYRLLDSDAQVGGECAEQNCPALVCTSCYASGVRHCARHFPDRQQLYNQALARFRRGELGVLVQAGEARARELAYLNRLQERIAGVTSLSHPLSGALLTITGWQSYLQVEDEREALMHLLDTGVLDIETTARLPLNASLLYSLPAGKKTAPLRIFIQSLAHLPAMVRDGFDSQPFSGEELLQRLEGLADAAQAAQTLTLAALASATGWDESARRLALGGLSDRPYTHRFLWVYLFDLYTWELLYNRADERLRRYADLFNPTLPSEQVDAVAQAVEKLLQGFDTLPLDDAASRLPYPPRLILQAFKRMEEGRRFRVIENPEFGPVLVRA